MTDAKQDEDALGWLHSMDNKAVGAVVQQHVRRLKALLARPVMPEILDSVVARAVEDDLAKMGRTVMSSTVMHVFDSLRDHLTAPKTREVEVTRWIVVYPGSGHTSSADFHCEADATEHAGTIGCVVKLTGKTTIPA